MSIGLKDLREYRPICKQIEQIEKRMKDNRRHVVDAVQTAADFPYWKHTIPIEGDIYDYDVTPDKKRLAELRARKAELERFVSEAPDYRIRRMLEVYFIEPCDERVTWETVADAMNDGSTGDAVKKRVLRFFGE